jgi:hypothetical protein
MPAEKERQTRLPRYRAGESDQGPREPFVYGVRHFFALRNCYYVSNLFFLLSSDNNKFLQLVRVISLLIKISGARAEYSFTFRRLCFDSPSSHYWLVVKLWLGTYPQPATHQSSFHTTTYHHGSRSLSWAPGIFQRRRSRWWAWTRWFTSRIWQGPILRKAQKGKYSRPKSIHEQTNEGQI